MTRTTWGLALALSVAALGCGGTEDVPDGGDAGSDGGAVADCTGMTDGTACGEELICVSDACVERGCGDGFVDTEAGEDCEDGNQVANDGCQPGLCVFTCTLAEDCDDMTACNGSETCSASHVCEDVPDLADGTDCVLTGGGDGVCRAGGCVARGCTDMIQNGTETDEDCGGGGCPACEEGQMCVANSDCIQYYGCPGGTCVRDAESDCLDGIDNNGDGLADCQDPTCTQVSCVPGGPAGSQLGVVSGSCPGGFGPGFAQNTGFHEGSCGGCGCTPIAQCKIRANWRRSGTFGCSGSPYDIEINGTAGQTSSCTIMNNPTYSGWTYDQIYVFGIETQPGETCSVTGTPGYTSGPRWDTSTSFCPAARTSDTCSSGQVCAPVAPSPMCINVPGNVGCPPGYASPTQYYTGFTPGGCSACPGCTPGNNACGTGVAVTGHTGLCCGCAGTRGPFPQNQCTSFSVTGIGAANAYFPINSGDCSVGQPSPNPSALNGVSTVCCM